MPTVDVTRETVCLENHSVYEKKKNPVHKYALFEPSTMIDKTSNRRLFKILSSPSGIALVIVSEKNGGKKKIEKNSNGNINVKR